MCEPDCSVQIDPGFNRGSQSALECHSDFFWSTNIFPGKFSKTHSKKALNQIPGHPIENSDKHKKLAITMKHAYDPTKFNKTNKGLDFITIYLSLV